MTASRSPSGPQRASQPDPSRDDRKLMLVLAYLGPLALVPYLVAPEDEEVRWHAKQGLTFTGVWIGLSLAIAILGALPGIGVVIAVLAPFIWLALIALVVVAIVNAVRGERFRIPFVADLSEAW